MSERADGTYAEVKAELVATKEFRDLYRRIVQAHVNEAIDALADAILRARALQDEGDGGWQDIDKLAARIVLEQTCGACPEQYDAKLDGALVGYLRLRHGAFRVDYPECGGETVFSAHPKGDGIFEEDEREGYLIAAKRAIAQAILPRPPHSKDSEG